MEPGQVVAGQYELERRLGRGGQGEVWLATDSGLGGRRVALKRARYADDPDAVRRLRREAARLAQVHHPNVVTVHTLVEHDEQLWVVMEYVPGTPMSGLGTADTPVDIGTVAALGQQIAAGLAAVHAVGILHRDLKPSNILITPDGTAKLVDFGIARRLDPAEATSTTAGAGLIGTPGYMPPEQVEELELTVAADIFSLGATLYSVLEGSTVFGTGTAGQLMRRTMTEPPRDPRRAGQLAPLLSAMLDRDPERRPDLAVVRRELALITGSSAPQLVLLAEGASDPETGAIAATVLPPAIPEAVPVTASRRRWLLPVILVSASVALVGGGVAAWALVTGGPDSGPGSGGTLSPRPDTTSATPATSPPARVQPTGKPGTVGDMATADICALVDQRTLTPFGEPAQLERGRAATPTCEVSLAKGGDKARATLELRRTQEKPPGTVTQVKAVGVARDPSAPKGECRWWLVLPTGEHTITVSARTQAGAPDVCGIADALSGSALQVLNAGEIPRRPS